MFGCFWSCGVFYSSLLYTAYIAGSRGVESEYACLKHRQLLDMMPLVDGDQALLSLRLFLFNIISFIHAAKEIVTSNDVAISVFLKRLVSVDGPSAPPGMLVAVGTFLQLRFYSSF